MAQSFGYGGCWSKVSPEVARRVATAGVCIHNWILPADVVNVDWGIVEQPSDCVLPCSRADFKSMFTIKTECNFHASKLEIGEFSLFVRHLARNARWHGKRVVVLADALATYHCVRKGRTSAPNMKMGMNEISAALLACDIRIHPCYI